VAEIRNSHTTTTARTILVREFEQEEMRIIEMATDKQGSLPRGREEKIYKIIARCDRLLTAKVNE
jgi:hypothetical protein